MDCVQLIVLFKDLSDTIVLVRLFISDFCGYNCALKNKKMVSTRQSSNMGNSSSSGSVSEVAEVSSLKKQHSVTTVPSNSGSTVESRNLNLLDLPVEVLEKIFSYLGFNMVAHMRLVSIKSTNIKL